VPLCPVLPLAAFVLEAFVGGKAEFPNRDTARRVLDFGIRAYVPNEDHFVYAFRHGLLQIMERSLVQRLQHLEVIHTRIW
jgi:hypothetical protein